MEILQKKCKKCSLEFPIADFYAKGKSRRDARCKSCIKEAKRERYRYHSKDSMSVVERLKRLSDIVYGWELLELDKLNTSLKEVIRRCKSGESLKGLDSINWDILKTQFKSRAFAEVSLGVLSNENYYERLKNIEDVFGPDSVGEINGSKTAR